METFLSGSRYGRTVSDSALKTNEKRTLNLFSTGGNHRTVGGSGIRYLFILDLLKKAGGYRLLR
jgi:hypothetical protein